MSFTNKDAYYLKLNETISYYNYKLQPRYFSTRIVQISALILDLKYLMV